MRWSSSKRLAPLVPWVSVLTVSFYVAIRRGPLPYPCIICT